jgi:hypothetical protein
MQRHAFNRARWLAPASFLLVGLAVANYPAHAQALDSSGVCAVTTCGSTPSASTPTRATG